MTKTLKNTMKKHNKKIKAMHKERFYSELNWSFTSRLLYQHLMSVTNVLNEGSVYSYHAFLVEGNENQVGLKAIRDAPLHRDSSLQETPAEIIFSQGKDGSIAALCYPHSSDFKKLGRSTPFILKIYKSSTELEQEIKLGTLSSVLTDFLRVHRYSSFDSIPEQKHLDFYKKIELRELKNSPIHPDTKDQVLEKKRGNIALGAAIVSGVFVVLIQEQVKMFAKDINIPGALPFVLAVCLLLFVFIFSKILKKI